MTWSMLLFITVKFTSAQILNAIFYSWERERACVRERAAFRVNTYFHFVFDSVESKVFYRKCFSIDPLLAPHISRTPSALLFLSFISCISHMKTSPSTVQLLHLMSYLMNVTGRWFNKWCGSRHLCEFMDSLLYLSVMFIFMLFCHGTVCIL